MARQHLKAAGFFLDDEIAVDRSLSPDPLSYQDSSSLYSFAAGDSVNRRDPRGTGLYPQAPNAERDLQAYEFMIYILSLRENGDPLSNDDLDLLIDRSEYTSYLTPGER